MEKYINFTCDNCKKKFKPGNRPDGTPNGLGFILQGGRELTLCTDCIKKVGEFKERNDEEGFKEFFKKLGVEV